MRSLRLRVSQLSLRRCSPRGQWSILIAASAVCMSAFNLLHVPAAFLLGAMLTAIAVALLEGTPRPPSWLSTSAQGIVGCLVASSFTPEILQVLKQDWLLFLLVTASTILLCSTIGWLLARRRLLPGSTAIWGSSPGGAMVMTLMSDRYGGDMRIVAVMQYSRVVLVTAVATAVAHFWAADGATQAAQWFPQIHLGPLSASILVGMGGAWAANRLNLPGGPLVWPMLLASILQMNGLLHIELPLWLLAPTYAILGWMVGLRFTRQALQDTARALPIIFGAIILLIALCAMLGTALIHLMHIDALTAYLATSPGGVDAVAIISTSSGADVPFVMAFQTARLFGVLIVGPSLAQFATRKLQAG